MNLFILEQLLNEEGSNLLTWKQLKRSKGLKPSGKKATWFRELETKIISEPLTRNIQQELIKVEKNLYAAKILMQPVSNDKRKKEWILFKESSKTKVGRISKKRV